MLTDSAKAAGLPAPFEWRGQTYQVNPPDLNAEIRFSALLEARDAEGVRRSRAALGEQGYQDALQQHRDDLAAGEYEWGGRVFARALRSDGGLREMAFLCLTKAHPDFSREQMHALFRDRAPRADAEGNPLPSKWDELIVLLYDLMATPKNGPGAAPQAPAPSSAPPT
ncbi:MAG: hypothetical protein KGL39_10765 [Patescibacteria group bacterium]|nr:hypothetical protein [Patescibacteria group bacterium]